jgi:hypothetical protein
VAVSPSAVDEDGATNLVYTFTRNDSSGALTVNFSIGGDGYVQYRLHADGRGDLYPAQWDGDFR